MAELSRFFRPFHHSNNNNNNNNNNNQQQQQQQSATQGEASPLGGPAAHQPPPPSSSSSSSLSQQRQQSPQSMSTAASRPTATTTLSTEGNREQFLFSDKRSPAINYVTQAAPVSEIQQPQAQPVPHHQPMDIPSPTHHSAATDSNNNNNNNVNAPPSHDINGKLHIKIIEAKDLACQRDGCPYVVATFESTEIISSAPDTSIQQDSQNPQQSTDSSNNSNSNLRAGIAIPSKSRQSSTTDLPGVGGHHHNNNTGNNTSNAASRMRRMFFLSNASHPVWNHEAAFDVVGNNSDLEITVYDAKHNDTCLGHVYIKPKFDPSQIVDNWYPLQPLFPSTSASGSIHMQLKYEPQTNKHINPQDFQVLRLIGKGTFGQVYQVRKKDSGRIYAMKVLSKKVIVQKKEIAHTIGERNILVRTAHTESPFIVGLKFSFQTPSDLYLVTDYMSGGELFWHLQREGRFSEDRAKFYIAELVLALQHLHEHGIVYRDLKPENILLDAKGHIALCDFGLSKANISADSTTNTFCGTTEYLAPEVLLDDKGYTQMVDFWSLGVLVFEMCCGWSPFFAEDTQQMYRNIAFGKVRFPRDALSPVGRSFVKGLLNRNPQHRLGAIGDAKELKAHPFFADVDWDALLHKRIPPPFKPHLTSETDTSNFDPEFTQASTSIVQRGGFAGSAPLSPTLQANFKGFTFVDESAMDENFQKAHTGHNLNTTKIGNGGGDNDDTGGARNGDEDDDDSRLSRNPQEDEDDDIPSMDNNDDDEDEFVHGQKFDM